MPPTSVLAPISPRRQTPSRPERISSPQPRSLTPLAAPLLLLGLGFLQRREDVLLLGPVGVGKTFLASALGHAACRAGQRVLFVRADQMWRELHQARADHTSETVLRSLLAPAPRPGRRRTRRLA